MFQKLMVSISLALAILVPHVLVHGKEKVGDRKQSAKNQSETKPEVKKTKPPKEKPPKTVGKLKEAWVGKLDLGVMSLVVQFRVVQKVGGTTAILFDSVTQNQGGFTTTQTIKGNTVTFKVPKIRASYTGTLNKNRDELKGTWQQGGRKIPLTMKKQATEYKNKNVWKNRPQKPVGPFPYDALDVKFPNKKDQLTLAGTLTIPKKAGRHPVAILISGSGPQDRDCTLMGHKPFLVLADYLSRRGIAVLRFDDRGTAKSTGQFKGATSEAFARDAAAAVQFLKKHPRIHSDQIGLIGHSEGGLIAPIVAGLRNDVAFIVLMAGTGVDGFKIVKSQSEAILRASKVDQSKIKIAMRINRAVLDVVKNNKNEKDLKKELAQAMEKIIQTVPQSEQKEFRAQIPAIQKRLSGKWMRFFLAYDPKPALAKIQCPVLAMIGSKDIQVLPDLNMPEIKKALAGGRCKDFQMVRLKGLNHLFQKCKTGALSEYVEIQETMNPEALKCISDWVVKRTTQKQPATPKAKPATP